MTVQSGLVATDPTAAILWDVSLPIERTAEAPQRAYRPAYQAHSPQRDLVALRNVTKIFPARGQAPEVVALKGVSLSVGAGEIYGIIGRSGAGKSTLIRLLNGLETPTTGRVEIARVELGGLTPGELRHQRRSIGMIFQHFNLLSSRTAFGNIALPLELAGTPAVETERRVGELLDLVGLADKRDAYPAELSGGQKQRVAIARALATNPRILLSDESTSSLDPETARSILALLAKINRELGVTIILITHQMAVIKQICHRVGLLEAGHLIEQAETYDFFADPQSDLARTLAGHDAGHALPADLLERLTSTPLPGGQKVLRLTIAGEAANVVALSQFNREIGVDVAILQGQVETIAGKPLGHFVISLSSDIPQTRLDETLGRLGIKSEVLGHVA
ncbi:ATP-binding cassette domain-containing protein [Dongia rigui]|uniref:ATP-binding cassette domain-containing protein n=2 Tax=Dongia rigui TaxID=940149 RepID=A0ABU5DUJ7_9PROT|nr:ATP-binding cassette domain-containing protein [Dongia rigui]MDY0870986.1 ATP-binding cassette domain-containing protein [Dongia rigui]